MGYPFAKTSDVTAMVKEQHLGFMTLYMGHREATHFLTTGDVLEAIMDDEIAVLWLGLDLTARPRWVQMGTLRKAVVEHAGKERLAQIASGEHIASGAPA